MAAFLRLQQQGEGGIALDVDPLDRIHLHRDFEAHGDPLAAFLGNEKLKENRPLTHYRQYSRSTDPQFKGRGLVTLPKLSIAAKLYAIFALMATTTVALSVVAVTTARHHAMLTDEFESANAGTWNVERVNGLIYAVVMESRGVYMSSDMKTSKVYADGIRKFDKQIAKVVEDWKKSVRGDDTEPFAQFSKRIAQFVTFRDELARLGTEVSPAAGRVWGDNDANRSVRKALNKDLETLTQLYATRATRVYGEMSAAIDKAALWLSLLAGFAVTLATAGALVISRGVAKPIAEITRVTEAVAGGDASISVPFSERKDEIGALARSIGVFQRAMQNNDELNRTVRGDAETRAQRQEQMSGEITRFSAEVEATLSELGRISDQMLSASTQLANAADAASAKTDQRDGRLGGSLLQCARHRFRGRRIVGLGERDRPPGGAIERHRHQGGERGRPDQHCGQGIGRSRRHASATWSS